MALTRKGKLFAGALFAGALFGPQPPEAAAEPLEYHGGRNYVSYEEVSQQWELLDLRLRDAHGQKEVQREKSHAGAAPHTTTKPVPAPQGKAAAVDTSIAAVLPSVETLTLQATDQGVDTEETRQAAAAEARRKHNEAALLLILSQV